jgi:ABC-type polar amino acid transport system ATPase subunit
VLGQQLIASQRLRITIAWVVLKKALVLLVDEPASGALEAESVRMVQDALEQEDVCVAGSSWVEARYCARLALRDVGTGEGFLNHQS